MVNEADKKQLLILMKKICWQHGETCPGCPLQYYDREGSLIFCLFEVIKERFRLPEQENKS